MSLYSELHASVTERKIRNKKIIIILQDHNIIK
jgi:hypothetical protein